MPGLIYKTIDKVDFEARSRNNANAVNRAAVEAATKIRFSAKIQGAKRERRWRLKQGKRLRLRLSKRWRRRGSQRRQR